MKYLSVCSGIEAATVAWHHMGWEPVAFSEIEKFPSQVLAHHYPNVPNWGDMTNYQEWPNANVNILVGGTPCQSFSVAGLRKGMADPRGNLALTYLAIADKYRPEWIVWENVPGVLSSNGGRDFGSFLGALAQLGYGFAYRVLDAQYFGVAQRRRRVFVVGHLGDWRPAAAVLFESPSLRRDSAPSRETRQSVAGTIAARFGISRNNHEECVAVALQARIGSGGADAETETLIPDVAGSLDTQCGGGKLTHQSVANGHIVAARMVAFGEYVDDGTASAMKARDWKDATDLVAQPIGFNTRQDPDAWQDRTGPVDTHYGTQGVAQPVAVNISDGQARLDTVTGTLDCWSAKGRGSSQQQAVMQPVAPALTASNDPSRSPQSSEVTQQVGAVYQAAMQVRRLTPTECERLQGFPDGYTDIKDNTPDGPRYKCLGNSMAVPVMQWIGQRIAQVDSIKLGIGQC